MGNREVANLQALASVHFALEFGCLMATRMHGRIELRLPDLDLPGVVVTACSWHAGVGQRVIGGPAAGNRGGRRGDRFASASGVLVARAWRSISRRAQPTAGPHSGGKR
jgi:hypothetical protein